MKASFTAPLQLASPSTLSLAVEALIVNKLTSPYGNGAIIVRTDSEEPIRTSLSFSSSVESSQGLASSSSPTAHDIGSRLHLSGLGAGLQTDTAAQEPQEFFPLSTQLLPTGPPSQPERQPLQQFNFFVHGKHDTIHFTPAPSRSVLKPADYAADLTIVQPRPSLASGALFFPQADTPPPPPPPDDDDIPPPPPEEIPSPAPLRLPSGIGVSESRFPTQRGLLQIPQIAERPETPNGEDSYRFRMEGEESFSSSEESLEESSAKSDDPDVGSPALRRPAKALLAPPPSSHPIGVLVVAPANLSAPSPLEHVQLRSSQRQQPQHSQTIIPNDYSSYSSASEDDSDIGPPELRRPLQSRIDFHRDPLVVAPVPMMMLDNPISSPRLYRGESSASSMASPSRHTLSRPGQTPNDDRNEILLNIRPDSISPSGGSMEYSLKELTSTEESSSVEDTPPRHQKTLRVQTSNGFMSTATVDSPSTVSAELTRKRSAGRTIGTDFFSTEDMIGFHALLNNPKALVASTPKSNYGPQVQPPLISSIPAGFDRFVYVYTHPMETPSDGGKFPEQGRYLVDGDMPYINATVTTKFIAPRASMLSDRSLQLPSSVTVVDLSQNSRLTEKVFSRLPPSLTYLDVRSMTVVSDASLEHLPRTLQFLNLRDAHDITDSGLSKLPKTLKHLKLSGSHKDFTCDAFSKLPSSLETLKINHLQKITKKSVLTMKSRLGGLTRLDLPGTIQMRDKCLKYLPPLLKHLNIRSVISLSGPSLNTLPQSIEFLDISSLPLTDQDLGFLPLSIAKLCVTTPQSTITTAGLSNLSTTSLQVLDLRSAFIPGVPSTIPPTLTALRLNMISPPVDDFFSSLPVGLQLLEVQGPQWEDKNIAQGLPLTLTWLALDANRLTPQVFGYLPKGIQYLHLRQMPHFSSNFLGHLPKSLKHLHLDPSQHNKRLLKECGRIFANFQGSAELASFGKYVFGAQDDTEDRPVVEDDNLWTPPELPENDTHDFGIGPDGLLVRGVGYLVPLNTLKISWSWAAAPFKMEKQPVPDQLPYDPTLPSLSPYDLHETARKVARRTLIPEPSSSAQTILGDLNDADIAQLPATVNELFAPSATSINEVSINNLPKDLVYLNLRSVSNFASSKALFRIFKKRKLLRTVILETNEFKSMAGIGHFPKSLTVLDLTRSTRLGDGCIDALPNGLTWLSLGSPKVKSNFPVNLTALTLENLHKVKAEFVYRLPRSLTHIDFYKAVEVEPTAISALPKHQLKYLNLHSLQYLRESCFTYLPRTLQYLSLASNTQITDKGIEALPRNLVHLDISSTFLSMLGIAALPSALAYLSVNVSQSSDRIECIAYLPRSLRILNYGGDIRDSWIEFLPPHLQYLNISYATSFSTHGIAFLPPSLTYLNIHSWRGSLVSASWRCQKLAVLDIYNADVANVDVHSLPKSIKYLNSASMHFQANCAAYFHHWNRNPARIIQEYLYPQGGYE